MAGSFWDNYRTYSPTAGGRYGSGPNRRLRTEGEAMTDVGMSLQGDSLSSLNQLDADYQRQIAAGGLTAPVRESFRMGQGAISDSRTRAGRAFAAGLMQRRVASGGQLSPEAALEYQVQHERDLNEQEFGARNQLTAEEANMGMQATQHLQDSIMAIRDRRLGNAENMTQQGAAMRIAMLRPRVHNGQNTQAVLQLIGSLFG